VAQTMYTHVSKCKNNKRKKRKYGWKCKNKTNQESDLLIGHKHTWPSLNTASRTWTTQTTCMQQLIQR
jgi:hypothetical protein